MEDPAERSGRTSIPLKTSWRLIDEVTWSKAAQETRESRSTPTERRVVAVENRERRRRTGTLGGLTTL